MICPNCGAENAEGAPFCYNCANPLPQPGASVPPGGTPPGSVPPGVPPGTIPPGSFPPGSVPPTGGPQWPGGGGPPYSGEPPRGPRNTFSAGLGALIAFLVVAAIGVVLFLTAFHKKEAVPPPPPVTTPPTTQAPTTAPPTTAPPTTAPPTSASPSPTGGNQQKFRNLVRIFFCKKLIGGVRVGKTIVGATPSGCSNPVAGGVNVRRTVPGFFVMISALDFEPGDVISTQVLVLPNQPVGQPFAFRTNGTPGSQRTFIPIPIPRGIGPISLGFDVSVNGTKLRFPVFPQVNLT